MQCLAHGPEGLRSPRSARALGAAGVRQMQHLSILSSAPCFYEDSMHGQPGCVANESFAEVASSIFVTILFLLRGSVHETLVQVMRSNCLRGADLRVNV